MLTCDRCQSAVRKLEARLEDEAHDRVNAEKRLRQDVEERIAGVETRLEVRQAVWSSHLLQNVGHTATLCGSESVL